MKFLRYFYFRLYHYYSKEPAPFFKMFSAIFAGLFLNFLTLSSLVSVLLKTKFTFFTVEKGIGRLWPLLIILPLFWILSYHFKKQGYHSTIIEEFENETSKEKLKSSLLVVFYFVSSMILFPVSLWIRQKLNGY